MTLISNKVLSCRYLVISSIEILSKKVDNASFHFDKFIVTLQLPTKYNGMFRAGELKFWLKLKVVRKGAETLAETPADYLHTTSKSNANLTIHMVVETLTEAAIIVTLSKTLFTCFDSN